MMGDMNNRTAFPLSIDEFYALELILTARTEAASRERRTIALDSVIAEAILACASYVIDRIDDFQTALSVELTAEQIENAQKSIESVRDALSEGSDTIEVYPFHASYLIYSIRLYIALGE